MKRYETYKVRVGNITIGHENSLKIQSMATFKTSDVENVVNQINELSTLGCDLMRVSIKDIDDCNAIYEIEKRISIPLIGDIHFDPNLAILAMKNGIDKIRINPGNIPLDSLNNIISVAKNNDVAIRIGINSGSLDKETLAKYNNKVTPDGMIDLLDKYLKPFMDKDFNSLILSLKSSSPLLSIKAYKMASIKYCYPLHLGITEAGTKEKGIIRSVVGLTPLLLDGIGDTIRISLTSSPIEEIKACKNLLHEVGLYKNMPSFISCPTCGRTEVDLEPLANKVSSYLDTINKPITVAIMGCVVNGPGEAKMADIGLAGGKNKFVLFKKGKVIKTIDEKDAYKVLIEEINKMI